MEYKMNHKAPSPSPSDRLIIPSMKNGWKEGKHFLSHEKKMFSFYSVSPWINHGKKITVCFVYFLLSIILCMSIFFYYYEINSINVWRIWWMTIEPTGPLNDLLFHQVFFFFPQTFDTNFWKLWINRTHLIWP